MRYNIVPGAWYPAESEQDEAVPWGEEPETAWFRRFPVAAGAPLRRVGAPWPVVLISDGTVRIPVIAMVVSGRWAMATSGDRDDARRGGPAMARMIGSLAADGCIVG